MRSAQRGYIVILNVLVWVLMSGCSEKPSIIISQGVIKETPPGRDTGAAYVTIENASKESLVLNYVHSARTDVIEVHQHLYDNGMMKMREVKHLTIDPGTKLEFSPGGYHLMLFGIDAPFEAGQSLELIFEFQNHPPQSTTAVVKRL